MSQPLAHLRFPVECARGRRYPEPSHPYRNDFQRDRDRVIHTRAFRRLENKTQVFTPGRSLADTTPLASGALSDHFRNRLTHTIEVSQIARTAASVLGLDGDLTEALALAHDIGHPPFAHSGEQELDRLMGRFGEHFEHNLHALRIVESFENPYARFPGLNLTFEVREGIVKHSRDFEPGEIPELDEYLPGLRPPVEAQLIDLCDEIAYNTADLDDGYSAGLVRVEDACRSLEDFRKLYEAAEMQFPGAPERVRVHEVVRGLINLLVSGLIEGTITAAKDVKSQAQVRSHPVRIAQFSAAAATASRQLKRFLRENVYCAEELVRSRAESARLIGALFDMFLERPERMPEAYREDSADEPLHRQVCDYIAGMTDGFLLRTCRQWGIS